MLGIHSSGSNAESQVLISRNRKQHVQHICLVMAAVSNDWLLNDTCHNTAWTKTERAEQLSDASTRLQQYTL